MSYNICIETADIELLSLNALCVFVMSQLPQCKVNRMRPSHISRHFADDIFKCISLNENIGISLKISLEHFPKVRSKNTPALVQLMTWYRPDKKILSESMMDGLLTHICVTRPQHNMFQHTLGYHNEPLMQLFS